MNSSTMKIAGEDALRQNIVETKRYIEEHSGVQSFNGRSGSVLPMAGDYSAEQVNYDSNQTVKQKIDALVTKEASDIAGQQSLVKDTVGWTGKNLLKNTAVSATARGVTRTVNSDGSITLDGTNSVSGPAVIELNLGFELEAGTYILSGTPVGAWVNNAGFRLQLYDFINSVQIATDEGSGKTFTLSENKTLRTRIWFSDGASISNKTFYPMVRKADITDPTYEPYHESVEVMYEEEIHGVNLLKNEATTQTINGVTFTVNADKSVTVNGTATANTSLFISKDKIPLVANQSYILSRGVSGDNDFQLVATAWNSGTYVKNIIDVGAGGYTEKPFTPDYNGYNDVKISIWVRSGKSLSNAIVKPMLRKADIDDPTYRPYNYQAIQNQLNAQGVLGAKNLLPNNVTSRTINGVTFTVNSDGSVTVNGTADPTATGNAWYPYYIGKMSAGKYLLNGCPTGGQETNAYFLFFRKDPDNASFRYYDTGNGVSIDIPNDDSTFICFICIWKGVTVNNLVFYPMIRLASDPDDTYQPYAMTNRELTEEKINIADLKTVVSASSDFADFKTRIASL